MAASGASIRSTSSRSSARHSLCLAAGSPPNPSPEAGLIDIVHPLTCQGDDLWNPTRVSAKTYSKFGSPMRDYRYVSMWAGPPNYDGTFDVDDYVAGIVRFGKQATMSLEVAWACNSEPVNYIEFLGDKGGIRLGAGEPILMTEMDGYQADVKLLYDTKRDAFAAEMHSSRHPRQGRSPGYWRRVSLS